MDQDEELTGALRFFLYRVNRKVVPQGETC